MNHNSSLKIIVLGAGPSGLSAAWHLVRNGHRVHILEKEPIWGGQSITFERGGYKYDLGPHNIHSQRKAIIDFLSNAFAHDFLQHNIRPQIYFHGKRINYPLMGIDVLKSLAPLTVISCALSFFRAYFTSLYKKNRRNSGSYETWIVNRFGRKLYTIFFAPYTEKVWKIPPREISDIVAKKRIAISGFIALACSLLFKKQYDHPENPCAIDSFYPRCGIGSVANLFAKDIIAGGGLIETNAHVKRIVTDQNRIKQIYYCNDGNSKCIDLTNGAEDSQWMVLSTIPVNELIKMLNGNVPETAKTAANGLDFTSEIFLYLNVKRRDVFGVPLLYFSEPEFPFNRIYDVGMFSSKMVPAGRNALCLEISCDPEDDLLTQDDTTLFNKCIIPLEKHGLIRREEIEGYHTRQLTHAYPRFRIGYEKKRLTILNYIATVSNLFSFGREGLFTYANIDDAIWMGFQTARNIHRPDLMRLAMQEFLDD